MADVSVVGCATMQRTVTPFERITNVVFGCPSIRRANGGHKTRFFSSKRDGGFKARGSIPSASKEDIQLSSRTSNPVYQLDEPSSGKGASIPRIWITERACGSDDPIAREFIAAYPTGDDKGGARALEYAERMLGEGFGASDMDHDHRVLFFQAAEILLLHSVERGNIQAAIKLGDLYRDDLCKGSYWESDVELRAKHASEIDSRSLLRRAWMLYGSAARKGSALAYVRLADMELASKQEDANRRAFTKLMRAYSMMLGKVDPAYAFGLRGSKDDAVDLGIAERQEFGSVLLRLAICFERGIGCSRSITIAKKLYEYSKMNLENAFESGFWRSKAEYIEAQRGYGRCVQETQIAMWK